MTVAFYMDVHIPIAITEQLRLRGVDVLTAIEDKAAEIPDDELLERAGSLNRVLFTQDIGFRVMAESWQRQGKIFSGLIFARQMSSIGQLVGDLELIAKASEDGEWVNAVQYLPLS